MNSKRRGFRNKVVIPAMIGGGMVKTIGKETFNGNKYIQEVMIPDCVSAVQGGAFGDCISLKKVHLSERMNKIVTTTFTGCSALEEVNVPDDVAELKSGTFKHSPLKKMHIGKSLAQINGAAFYEGEVDPVTYKGHSWQASPNERISKGRRCPYCAHNPRVLPGENDLATVRPDLLQEWDYEKNTILPNALTAKSNKRIWWKCSKGHEWRTSVEHRTNGSGCPYCAKGAQTSFPEQAIYYYVKKAYPDAINKYKNLFTTKGMELDVFIPSIKTGIEYDGIAFHRSERQLSNDRIKSTICNNNGIRLIRIKEDPTLGVFPTDTIISANYGLENALFQLASIVPKLGAIDLKKDEDDIRKGYLSLLENSSLLARNPNLCKEWNYEKNKTTPDMYSPNSNTRVWWKCMLGHEWKTSIDERNKGRKCPYCSNRLVLSGFNDLATKRPDLTREWNSEKNKDLDPTKILPGSGKKAWWICKNGHEWQAEVSSRNKGAGCPMCAKNKRSKTCK